VGEKMNEGVRLTRSNVEDIVGLSNLQKNMLFQYEKNEGTLLYNVKIVMRLNFEVNEERFDQAWNYVVKKNSMLRTVFRWKETKEPVQIILKDYSLDIHHKDTDELENEAEQSINLEERPFFIELVHTSDSYYMILKYHHILFDGWGLSVIMQEFIDAYKEAKGPDTLIHNVVEYKEFIKILQKRDTEKEKQFWNAYLKEYESNKAFRDENNLDENNLHYSFQLPDELVQKMDAYARKRGISTAIIFYHAWGVLLKKFANNTNTTFDVVVSGRSNLDQRFEHQVGLYTNALPFLVNYDDSTTIDEELLNIQNTLNRMFEVENTPIQEIRNYTKIHDIISETSFAIENYPLGEIIHEETLPMEFINCEEHTIYKSAVSIEAFHDTTMNFCYKKLFTENEIINIGRYYQNILFQIVDENVEKNSEISLMSADDIREFDQKYNNNKVEINQELLIHHLFEKQVELHPNKIVVRFSDGFMTYQVLNNKANKIAHRLIHEGVQRNEIVGICCERSLELIFGLMAVLKAGAAFMFLDPKFPQDRLKEMIQSSQTKYVLCQSIHRNCLENIDCNVTPIDNDLHGFDEEPIQNPDVINEPTDLSYVIYTSGSTGKPKGAMNTHLGLLNHKQWMQNEFHLTESDVVLHKTPLTFDVSVWEIFWTLGYGGEMVVALPDLHKDPRYLAKTIRENHITIVHFVPAMLELFLECAQDHFPDSLRGVIVSGENLNLELINRFYKFAGIPLYNVYGPAECADVATSWLCEANYTGSVTPIGKCIDNVKVYILDPNLHRCPIGMKGEIYISGYGVGKGYINRTELTKESFIQDIYDPEYTMYKTGDIGAYLENGTIEFYGRRDHQIKIGGQRIELQEIERCMLQHPDILNAVVVVSENQSNKFISSYYTTVNHCDIESDELRKFMSKTLPNYMIPSVFTRLNELPLSVNGKINRNALETMKAVIHTEQSEHSEHSDSPVIQSLCHIFSSLLNVEYVDVKQNFFEMGMNSLGLIKANEQIQQQLHVEVPLSVLFEYPNITLLGEYLRSNGTNLVDDTPDKQEDSKEIQDNDIAVIGMSGRFPGADNVKEYWDNLIQGKETLSHFIDEELKESGIPEQLYQKKNYVRVKGILNHYQYFDNNLFHYSANELNVMDPQIRILLEIVWEALEDAGYDPKNITDITGAFLGTSPNYYWLQKLEKSVTNKLDEFSIMIMNEKDFVASIIAYNFNFTGPVMTVQTACSTSMTGINEACKALRNNECKMAVAGAASLTYPIKQGYLYHDGMIFSDDGHCRAFDEKAKGTVGSNGAGVVVLKKLSQAIKDRDPIKAVIKGIAIDNDGSTRVGFTAPGIQGQIRVLEDAIKDADLPQESISYIETHGTGTPLGDMVEISAIKRAYGNRNSELRIGSVKTNVGHLDVASGVAGMIKVVLSLQNRFIPPTLHFTKPNKKLELKQGYIVVNNECYEWDSTNPLRAAVSSFGIGGTNVHAILEEAPKQDRQSSLEQPNVLLLSAETEQSLKDYTKELTKYLSDHEDIDMNDAAYTLQIGRHHGKYRNAVRFSTRDDAIEEMEKLQKKEKEAKICNAKPKIVFLFQGQDQQYINMGKELYQSFDVFHKNMDQCFRFIETISGRQLQSILYPAAESDETFQNLNIVDQYFLIFSLEYALAKLLIDFGIKPNYLIGYSFGEIVATTVAEAIPLNDSIKFVYERSRLLEEEMDGAMLSIPLSGSQIKEFLPESIDIAIDNGDSCIVSGTKQEMDILTGTLREKSILVVPLQSQNAMHSRCMERASKSLRKVLNEVSFSQPVYDVITTLKDYSVMDADYFEKQMKETIYYTDAVKKINTDHPLLFIEIGTGSSLGALLKSFVSADFSNTIRSVNEVKPDLMYFISNLGRMWESGAQIQWNKIYHTDRLPYRISIPTYAFDRKEFLPKTGSVNQEQEITLRAEEQQNPADGLLYTQIWSRMMSGKLENPQDDEKKNWLIFIEDDMDYSQLFRPFVSRGDCIVFVKAGKSNDIDSNMILVDPQSENCCCFIVNELVKQEIRPNQIVYLWSLGKRNSELTKDQIGEALNSGYYSLLHLAKEMMTANFKHKMMLHIITANSFEVIGNDLLYPEYAPVIGAGNAIAAEYKNIACRFIDIDGKQKQQSFTKLQYDLDHPSDEEIIAYRGNYRWKREFVKYQYNPKNKLELRRNGVYFITGGLGGIGLTISKRISRMHPVTLILAGRSSFIPKEEWENWKEQKGTDDETSQKIQILEDIEKNGSKVVICQLDISDYDSTNDMVSWMESEYGPINGVIHCAGIADGGLIQMRQDIDSEKVFEAKIYGTVVLYQLFAAKELDFIVSSSSLSAFLKIIGQAAYSAANAFVNAFSFYQKDQYPGNFISISWDAWNSVGMSYRALKEQNKKTGAETFVQKNLISPEEGANVFDSIVLAEEPQIIVTKSSLQEVIRDTNENGTAVQLQRESIREKERSNQQQPLQLKSVEEIQNALIEIFTNHFGKDDIEIDQNFFDYGASSLDLIRISMVIKERISAEFDYLQLFQYSTIASLASLLAEGILKESNHDTTENAQEHEEAGLPQRARNRNLSRKNKLLEERYK
jgi:amino acid adenylation domain-containing protein